MEGIGLGIGKVGKKLAESGAWPARLGKVGLVLVAKDWLEQKTDERNEKNRFKWIGKGGEKWKIGPGRVGNRAEEGVAEETWPGGWTRFFLPPPHRHPPGRGVLARVAGPGWGKGGGGW